jgi:hypothetical protein
MGAVTPRDPDPKDPGAKELAQVPMSIHCATRVLLDRLHTAEFGPS